MFDLAGMLSGITEQNRHGEVAPDASVGGEAW